MAEAQQCVALFCALLRSLQDKVREATPGYVPRRGKTPQPQSPQQQQHHSGSVVGLFPAAVPPLPLSASPASTGSGALRALPRPPASPAPVPDPGEGASSSSVAAAASAATDDVSCDGVFPRRTPFYATLVAAAGAAARGCADGAVLVALQWHPAAAQLSPAAQAALSATPRFEALKFKFFVDSYGSGGGGVAQDFMEAVAALAVFDVLSAVLFRDAEAAALSPRTREVLVDLLFVTLSQQRSLRAHQHQHQHQQQQQHSAVVSAMVAHAREQGQRVLWAVSPFCLDVLATRMRDSLSGVVPEDGVPILRGLRGVRMNVGAADASAGFLTALLELLRKSARTQARAAQLDLLRAFVLSADCSNVPQLKEVGRTAFRRIQELVKKSAEELEQHALLALCAVLVRCDIEEELEPLLKRLQKCAASGKKKEWVFGCVAILLRGHFVPNPPGWMPPSLAEAGSSLSRDAFLRSEPFMFASSTARVVEFALSMLQPKSIKTAEFFNEMIEIATLLSAGNLKLGLDSIFRPLVESDSRLLLLLGLRGLSRLLKSEALWEVAPAVRDKTSSVYVSRETFFNLLSKASLKALDIFNVSTGGILQPPSSAASNAAAAAAAVDVSEAFGVAAASGMPLSPLPPLTVVDETPGAPALRHSIHRWHAVVNKPLASRVAEFDGHLRKSVSAVQSAVDSWFGALNIPLLLPESGSPPPRPVSATPRTRGKKSKALDPDVALLFKEFLAFQTIAPEAALERLGDKHKLCAGLLSDDEDIVNTTARTLMQMMANFPPFRPVVLQSIVQLIAAGDLRKPVTETLAVHLLALLDLWIVCIFNSASSPEAALPEDEQIVQAESVALLCLCSSTCTLQVAGIRVLSVLSLIARPSGRATWSRELFSSSAAVSSSAKHSFLRHALRQKVAFAADESKGVLAAATTAASALPFEHMAAASSAFPRLWSCFLEAIGKFSVGCSSGADVASRTRALLAEHLAKFDLSDPAVVKSPAFAVWRNMSTLLVSMCGDATASAALASHMQKTWERLLDDSSEVADALEDVCCQAHQEAVPVLVTTILQFWRGVSDSQKLPEKKKGAVFSHVIAMLRSITDAEDFARVLRQKSDLVWHLVPLFDQLPAGMFKEDPAMTAAAGPSPRSRSASITSAAGGLLSSLHDTRSGPFSRFLVNFVRTIRNVCSCLERTPRIAHVPVRASVVHPIDPMLWKPETRRALFEKLHFWSTGGDFPREKGTEQHLKQIKRHANGAAEALVRIGPLMATKAEPLPRKIIEWAMETESAGGHVLYWIIAFHFDKTFPQFLSEVHTSKGGIIYTSLVDAIYEHFFHADEEGEPQQGEGEDEEPMSAHIETKLDESISRDLTLYGGALLHLCLKNIACPSKTIRVRTFAVIDALAPLGFGSSMAAAPDGTAHLRMLSHKGGIKCSETTEYERHAYGVSEVLAECCSPWTLTVFNQAFSTASSMTPEQKRWTLRFLTPWCNNLVLSDDALEHASPDTFLEAPFREFSIDLLSSGHAEVVADFWTRLARNSKPTNVTAITTFLLKMAAQDDRYMPAVKTILMRLFDAVADAVPPLVVRLLSFGASQVVFDLSKEQSSEYLKTPRVAKRMRPTEVAATVLVDLMPRFFRSLMPLMPSILCHSLLHHGEHRSFRELLSVTFESLVIECEQSGRPHDAAFAEARRVAQMLARPRAQLGFGRHRAHPEYAVSVQDIVESACNYLRVLDQQVIDAWAAEAFLWARGDKDNPNAKREARALCMLRSLSIFLGPPQKYLVKELAFALCSTCESIDQLLLERNAAEAAPAVDAALANSCHKAEETMLCFLQFCESLNHKSDRRALGLMFWSAVACMLNPDPSSLVSYTAAVELVARLGERRVFERLKVEDLQPFAQLLHRDGHALQFIGLQRIAFRGMLNPATQSTAARLLLSFVGASAEFVPASSVLSPLSDPNRDALTLLGLLPWLHSTLVCVKRGLAQPALLVAIARDLSERLVLSKLKCTRSAEIMRSVADNAGAVVPEMLLGTVVGEMHEMVFPTLAQECIDTWTEQVQFGAPLLGQSALEAFDRLLAARQPDLSRFYLGMLGDLQKSAVYRGPMSAAATRVLTHISDMITCQVAPREGLPISRRSEGDSSGIRSGRVLRSVKVVRIALNWLEGSGRHSSREGDDAQQQHQSLFKPRTTSEIIAKKPKHAAPHPPLIPEEATAAAAAPPPPAATPLATTPTTPATSEAEAALVALSRVQESASAASVVTASATPATPDADACWERSQTPPAARVASPDDEDEII